MKENAQAFYLEVIRKEGEQVKAELAAARAELRARDEAIADFDERARWRLAQKPYTGIGEP